MCMEEEAITIDATHRDRVNHFNDRKEASTGMLKIICEWFLKGDSEDRGVLKLMQIYAEELLGELD